MPDGLKRDIRGVRALVHTSTRVESFNDWHRANCEATSYYTDIDGLCFRYRHGSLMPVAIIETKRWHVIQPQYVLSAATIAHYKLARLAGIKYYFIWYNEGCSQFRVWDVCSNASFDKEKMYYSTRWVIMDSEQLKKFIDNLK